MTWLPGWYYRKQVTVLPAFVDDDLTNFPLCVPLGRADVDFHQGVISGQDIRFTLADGVTLLPHEWTGWTDSGFSGAFVKIPSIDATGGATLYLYYGNESAVSVSDPANVWNDYAVAAHFDNYVDGQEESASGYALTQIGSVTPGPGVVGGGVELDGTNLVRIGDTGDVWNLLSGETGFTLSVCVQNLDNTVWNHRYVFFQDQSGQPIFCSLQLRNDGIFDFCWYPQGCDFDGLRLLANHGLSVDDDAYITATFGYGGGLAVIKAYVNGVLVGTISKSSSETAIPTLPTPTQPFSLGQVNYGLEGVYDEVRIRKGTASAAEIKFHYANLMSSGNQISLATEESLPVVAGPYLVAVADSFQAGAQQSETYIPGIIAGHTHGT